jgi:tetratricopeptide (TPR) repeat protein
VADESVADHPHRPLLVAAYRRFRAGDPRAALDLLEPVIGSDELANRSSVMAGVLWGLAGDCYFRLGQPDSGFRAYLRAIALDGTTGCLALFACQVAWHRRAEYAEQALECLRAARTADGQALRRHPAHFLWHSCGMDAIYFRFVQVPLARWRLRRLAALTRA